MTLPQQQLRSPNRWQRFRKSYSSIVIAGIGPGTVAFAHLLQSLLLVRHLDRADFGTFSFIFATVAFSWAICSALFCVPLASLLFKAAAEERSQIEASVATTNLLVAALSMPIFMAIGLAAGLGHVAAMLLGAFNGMTQLRWFGRAQAYCHGRQLRSVSSDLLYGFVLIAALGIMAALDLFSLTESFLAMAVAAFAGLLPLSRSLLRTLQPLRLVRNSKLYWSHSRSNVGWTLLYPLATEVTANAHVYIVSIMAGPSAFSTLAATALLLRPMTLISTSVRDVERPRLARVAASSDGLEMVATMRRVRLLLVAVWVATVSLTVLLFVVDPGLLFPSTYSQRDLVIGATLWSLVGGVAMIRVPESALLQATGSFRGVSLANLAAAVTSIIAVTIIVLLVNPVWTIGGVLAGQLLQASAISHYARRWREENIRPAQANKEVDQ